MKALSQRALADKANATRSLVEQLIEKEEANFEARERNHLRLPKDAEVVDQEEVCPMVDEDASALSRKRMRSPCKPHTEEADLSSPLAQRPRIVVTTSSSPDIAGTARASPFLLPFIDSALFRFSLEG